MTQKAFTIAEVLITLGLIGILALVAVPTLNKNNEQKVAKDFERVYQNLNSNVFYHEPIYKNQQLVGFKLELDNIDKCTKDCFANSYKTISGNHYPINLSNSKKGILLFGERVAINKHGTVYVDINGPKAPNTKCKDLFEFEYFNSHIYPANTHTQFFIKDIFYNPNCSIYSSDIENFTKCEKSYHTKFKLSNAISKYTEDQLLRFIHTEGKYCELKIVADNFVIKY